MTPEDDASWPICDMHGAVRHWCSMTRDHLIANWDAENIQPGTRVCVPACPAYKLYAEVSISPDLIADMSAGMALVKSDELLGMNEEFIPMGLWTRGEGRVSIAAALTDWTRSADIERCQAGRHGFRQEMEYQRMESSTDGANANRWCIAYYGMCLPCKNSVSVNPTQSFDASSFGINPSEFQRNPQTRDHRRQQQARDALRQRFGNGS